MEYIVEKLLNRDEDFIHKTLAERPDLFNHTLYFAEKLAESDDYETLEALLTHPDLITKSPSIFIEKLINRSSFFKEKIAKHPDLFHFLYIAEKLADDEDRDIRALVAAHPDLFNKAPHLVEKFANDKNSFVCKALEKNAHKQGIDLKEFLTQYFKTS